MSTGVRIAAALGGLLLVTQIVLLTIQLHVLTDSRAHIRSQDSKISRLYEPLQQTSHDAAPLLRDAHGLVKPLRTEAGDLVRATDVLPGLALTTRELVSEAVPAARDTQRLVAAILGRNMIGTLEQAAADGHAARGIAGESMDIQRRTLRIQQQSLRILRKSLAIQQATLQHAESIDRKTGGTLPAP
jgi:hypothetical protein